MLAIRNPLNPNLFDVFRREFDNLFDFDGVRPIETGLANVFVPAMNAWEDGDTLVIEAEMPGVAEKDLDLTVTADTLTLRGKREVSTPENARVHRTERRIGTFARTLSLPAEVDADKVEAKLTNGVLTIRLPKAPRTVARRIAIKAE